jgi:DNA-binding transcriptional MocR family regulator
MNTDNGTAKVRQALERAIRRAAPGAPLPSVRALVATHHVSPVTVHRVLQTLSREGLLVTRPGAGTFVAAQALPLASNERSYAWQTLALGAHRVNSAELVALTASPVTGQIVLSNGYLGESLQPLSLLAAGSARAARRPGTWGRQPPEGIQELRAWFSKHIAAGFRDTETLIVSGGQAALALIFRALASPGDRVLVDSPTYLGAVVAARAAGLIPIPVPTDSRGVLPEALEQAFQTSGAKLYYAQPTYANPSGTCLGPERRKEIVEIAQRREAFVIEDDSFRDLALEGEAPAALASIDAKGHVIYLQSLTKSTAPGIRVAALCAHGAAFERLRAMRSIDDLFVSGPLQETALELVSSAGFQRHLSSVRRTLRERRDALVQALRAIDSAYLANIPTGGLHLWLTLPQGHDDRAFANACAAQGVAVSPGAIWFPAEAPGPFLRLSYGVSETSDLCEGARRIARLLRIPANA